MLLPSQFFDQFGLPQAQSYNLSAGATQVVPFSRYRYLLVFKALNNPLSLRPDRIGITDTLYTLATTADPLVLTHALHGSYVNCGWVVTNGGIPTTLVVVQAFMTAPATEIIPAKSMKDIDPALLREFRQRRLTNDTRPTGYR